MTDLLHSELMRRGLGAKAWPNRWTEIEYLGGGRFGASMGARRGGPLLMGGEAFDPAASFADPTEDGYIVELQATPPTYSRYNAGTIIRAGKAVPDYVWLYRGYVEWDISSLPESAMVSLLKFKYHGATHNIDCHIHEMMGTRPSTGGNQAVFDEAGEGNIYAEPAGFPEAGTTKEVTLSAQAITDLEAQLGVNWFAIGIQSDNEATTIYQDIASEEYGGVTPPPTLYIEYIDVQPPTVTTQDATEAGRVDDEGHGTLHGNITATGGKNADERGFDWDVDSGAPYANEWTETDSFGTGAFLKALTTFPIGSTIYFRAKAHNSYGGWGYGSEKSFVIGSAYTPPGFSGTALSYKAMVWEP